MLKCPSCGTTSLSDSQYCHNCGYSYTGETGKLDPDTVLENRYIIVKALGRGGMGAVYQALDLRLNKTPVAIKEMSTRAVGQGNLQAAIAAFKKEANMLISLRHSALPRISDFFSRGEDRWYLVMDYIKGETLAEVVKRRGPIPEAEVLDWAVQLCDILGYLHGQNPPVIFRDIKLSNIMITPDEEIRLVDFGIARHFRSGLTSDTIAYGSPGYAPPEQYGEYQTDPRSDIYSLGAVLHHLLTGIDPGKTPFTFERPGKTILVSPAMDLAIMKALELNPEKRPVSAREMLELIKTDKPCQPGKTWSLFIEKEEPAQISELQDEENSDSPAVCETLAGSTETLLINEQEDHQKVAVTLHKEVETEAIVGGMVTADDSIKEMLERARRLEEQGDTEEALNTYQLTCKLVLPGSMLSEKLKHKINEVKRKLELGLYSVEAEQKEDVDVIDGALSKLMIKGRLNMERGKYKEALDDCLSARILIKVGSIEAQELNRMIRHLKRKQLVITPDNRTRTLYIKDKSKALNKDLMWETTQTQKACSKEVDRSKAGLEEKLLTETLTIDNSPKGATSGEICSETTEMMPVSIETPTLNTKGHCPVLKSVNGEEKILIDKKDFTMGRDREKCDYIFLDTFIGRTHAKIINEGGYYIVDLNSKNGTYINGKSLISNKKYELKNNDRIRFASKEYCFILR